MPLNLDACTVFAYGLHKEKMVQAGFEAKLLEPKFQKALKLVDDHLEINHMPAPDDLIKLFGEGIIEECHLSPEYLVGELKKRFLHHYLATNFDTLACYIKNGQPEEGLAFLQQVLEKAPVLSTQPLASSLTEEIEAVKSRTKKALLGEDGIDTPWPSFNEMTRGFLPCESTWFVARSGIGKTWIILILCTYFWLQRFQPGGDKVRILFISPELKKAEVAERVFTFATSTSYSKVVAGSLDTHAQQEFFEKLSAYVDIPDFYIMDEDDEITPERIQRAIEEFEPDIVGLDASYEIAWSKNPYEKNPFEVGVELIRKWTRKSWAAKKPALWASPIPGKKSISILAASQVNRSGAKTEEKEEDGKGKKGKKKPEVSPDTTVAMTDKIFWKADRLLLLEQSKDEADDNILRIKRIKVRRRGKDIPELTLYWDLDGMNFEEIGVKKEHQDTIPSF